MESNFKKEATDLIRKETELKHLNRRKEELEIKQKQIDKDIQTLQMAQSLSSIRKF